MSDKQGNVYKGMAAMAIEERCILKSLFSFLPFTSNVTIARNSLSNLRYSLIKLYELEKMEGMDA
jgi:hypothetical protein